MLQCTATDEVIAALAASPRGLIAIDGFQASGKSTLARSIGAALALEVISVDDFLLRNQGSFYAHLDLAKLSSAVINKPNCVVEGVCCLQVLEALRLQPTVLVYVKRMAMWGWADEDELEQHASSGLPTEAPTDPLAVALRNLWDEVARYHTRFRPHEHANIIYERSAA